MTQRLTSARFPYLPVEIGVGRTSHDVEALLNTGFDGDAILPSDMGVDAEPDWYVLTDLTIVIMGDEPIVGRGVMLGFTIVLDHGSDGPAATGRQRDRSGKEGGDG